MAKHITLKDKYVELLDQQLGESYSEKFENLLNSTPNESVNKSDFEKLSDALIQMVSNIENQLVSGSTFSKYPRYLSRLMFDDSKLVELTDEESDGLSKFLLLETDSMRDKFLDSMIASERDVTHSSELKGHFIEKLKRLGVE